MMRGNKKGFTLTEMLVVIAIMAVLSAVAIPAILALRHDLKMTELNSVARELFLAAQNDLTARRAAGTLGELGELVEGEDLMLLYNDDAATAKLLPAGTVEGVVAGGHYALRLNPESATMFEVFYSEDVFTSDEVTGIESQNLSGADGTQARWEAYIGYYNGDDLGLGKVTPLSAPVLEIINEDELKVIVTVPNATNYWGAGVKLTVTVEALDGTGASFSSENCSYIGGTYEWVLDSLTGAQFKNICSGITPGADILVTAKLSADDTGDTRYLSAQASAQTNSLFADGSKVEDNGTIYVAWARHLQNLDAQFANGGTSLTSAADKFYVEQTAVITWPGEVEFQSISSHAEIAGFNGNKLEIIGLKGKNGLFAYVSGCTMKNIYIVNPALALTGSDSYAGAGCLAGSADNSTIDGCRVYSDALSGGGVKSSIVNNSTSAQYTGGLIGRGKDVAIRDCFSALHAIHAAGGNSVIGGLAGYLDTSSVINCYAVVDQMSGTPVSAAMLVGNTAAAGVTIKDCYAVGNITATTGTISGFANGGAAITNSYCAVTYLKADGEPTGATVTNGFAQGGDITCVYLAAGITPTNAGENAKSKSYREMTREWNPWGTNKATAVDSHPYQEDLEGRAYPYPALSVNGGVFPHYGSWPEQSADGIKLYDGNTKDSKELYVIFVPVGKQSTTVYAEVQSGGKNSMQQITVTGFEKNNIINAKQDIQTSYDKTTGRTAITITTKPNSAGVTYVDLTAGGITLRAVVVAYEASLALEGWAAGSKVPVNNSAASDSPQSAHQVLSLEADNNATFKADLKVSPAVSEINSKINTLRTNLVGMSGIELSTPKDYQILDSDWRGFQVVRVGYAAQTDGPGVTVNPVVDAENNIYILADSAGTSAQYPVASGSVSRGGNGKTAVSAELKIVGRSAGTAQVAVSWAMDDRLTVVCPVNVSGAQVAIKSVSVTEQGDRDLGSNSKDYPYLLHIKPAPKKEFTLHLEAELFGNPPVGATDISYSWTVSKSGGEVVGNGTGQAPDIMITDKEPQANYRVKLVYSYQTDGKLYATSDFMHITVTRVTEKFPGEAGNIDITLPDGMEQLVLEQIDWGVEVEAPSGWPAGKKLNEATVYGQVEGSADTQLEWYLKKDAYNYIEGSDKDIRITGQEGSLEVKGPEGKIIAVLNWSPEEVPDRSRGGQVTVAALDSSYYGTDEHPNSLTFTLIARARDNSVNPEEKEVTVTIMPKLRITPQSKVMTGWNGVVEATFSANRADTSDYRKYSWTCDRTDITFSSTTSQTAQVSTGSSNVSSREYAISLEYGPYKTNATLIAKRILNAAFYSSINWDGQIGERGYFLVQKNRERTLEYAWGHTVYGYKIDKHPSVDPAIVTLTPKTGDSGTTTSGAYSYAVYGKAFSKGAITLDWEMYYPGAWLIPSDRRTESYNLYIVGAEFLENEISVGKEDDESLTLTSYFPSAVDADGGIITLQTSAEDIISVSGEGVTSTTDEDEKTVYSYTAKDSVEKELVVTGKRYGSVVLSATYEVGGESYTDSCVIRVEPEAGTLSVKLEPCSRDDLGTIKELFGLENLPAHAATYADYAGNRQLTLLTDAVFGHDTLYLKTYVVDGDGDVVSADPNVFAAVFASGNSYVASCESRIGRMTDENGNEAYCYFLEIKGKNGMRDGEMVEITASFGTLTKTEGVWVYSQPSVVFEPADMTNDHTVIFSSAFTAGKKRSFSAHLEPLLLDEDGKALDSLKWYLEYPEKENDAGFLVLAQSEDGTFSTVELLANPWLKVAVTAQSRIAYEAAMIETDANKKWMLESTTVAAYALVFLPDPNSP